ncbi:MAG TPA: hypothetical protein VMF91_00085 [Bryobacteraceae bacterium]|nr:hypothetical protein [Bryobacteraceae bacterium]
MNAISFAAIFIDEAALAVAHWIAAEALHASFRSALLIAVAEFARAFERLAGVVDAMFRLTFSTGFARLAVGFQSFADVIDAAVRRAIPVSGAGLLRRHWARKKAGRDQDGSSECAKSEGAEAQEHGGRTQNFEEELRADSGRRRRVHELTRLADNRYYVNSP